jgi:type II secretory pathway pseudopilin PulG
VSPPLPRFIATRLRTAAREDGFTVLEMLWAAMLLAVIAGPLVGVLMASNNSQSQSRERTVAEQAATAQIESIRRLPYASVGIVNGNPSGSVVGSQPLRATGLSATMRTQITYVNDPTPTGYATEADYKRVVVTVARTRDNRRLAKQVTYVPPPGRAQYAGVNEAIARVQVLDSALNAPVAGATVTLGSGPSATRTDTTDTGGSVSYAALTANPLTGPQAYYDLTVAAAGYQTLRDDVPPGASAHVQLAPGQTFSTVLRVYKPATIVVALTTSTGAPYTGPATVIVASPRAAQAFSASGGMLTVTQLGGEPVVPNLGYTVAAWAAGGAFARSVAKTVPNAYPTDLTSSFAVAFGASTYATSTLTVNVQNTAGAPVAGARVDVSGGPAGTYLTATSDAAGRAVFSVPTGTGYTATASTTSPATTGTWSGGVPAATTATVWVS